MKKIILFVAILSVSSMAWAETYTVERVIDGETLLLTNGETVKLIGVDAPPYFGDVEEDFFFTYDPSDEILEELQKWGIDIGTLAKMGKETTEFVKGLGLEGKEVRLEFDVQERNKHGWLLAYVYVSIICKPGNNSLILYGEQNVLHKKEHIAEIFLNKELIKWGYAQSLVPSEAEVMTILPNGKYADLFQELYEEAREKGRGLWKDSNNGTCKVHSDCICEGNPDIMDGCGKPGQVWKCIDGRCQLVFEQVYEAARENKRGLWTNESSDDESFLREFNSEPKAVAIPMH